MNIIIAGASRGIGNEVVKKFSLEGGNKVLLLSRNLEKLNDLVDDCLKLNPESEIFPVKFDLGDGDFNKLNEIIEKKLGRVDIVIYTAGLLVNKPVKDITSDDFDKMMSVNFKGAFFLVQSILPLFNKDSHIVNISSMGGYQGSSKFPGLSIYSASKGALGILSECMAEEFSENGIKCNCLAIGAVQTEMLNEAFPGYKAPLSPVEMAEYIVNFAKTGHRFYNGKILPVSVSTP